MSSQSGAVEEIARSLLKRRGDFSMDELAARAGIAKATIYRRFGSKAAIVRAAGGVPEAAARERIVEAALRAIPRRGLAATTMQQIAREAGVASPSLYWHFKSKDELLLAAVDHLASQLNPESLLAEMPRLDDPRATLAAFMGRALETQVAYVDFVRTMMVEVGNQPELAAAVFDRVVRRMWGALTTYLDIQVAAGAFRPGHSLLRVIALAGAGIFFNLARRNFGSHLDLPPTSVAVDEFLGIFLDGVRSKA